jgi:muskelin
VRKATFWIRKQQCVSFSPFVIPSPSSGTVCRFIEMALKDPPVKALNFLQTEVSSVVDHEDPEETAAFRALLAHLLTPSSSTPVTELKQRKRRTESPGWTNRLDEDEPMADIFPERPHVVPGLLEAEDREVLSDELYRRRTEVFESLLEFVGERAKQPRGELVQLIERADWSSEA